MRRAGGGDERGDNQLEMLATSTFIMRTREELEAGLDDIRRSPREEGTIALIVRRPARDAREVLAEAMLDPVEGLLGDSWRTRGNAKRPDGLADPDAQLTLMNARLIALVAGSRERWPLAGDQLYVDLDLSVDSLDAGTRLVLGMNAIIEVTAKPHTGCGKFSERFGVEALKFVNCPAGRELRLRGIHARVLQGGLVRPGDPIRRR